MRNSHAKIGTVIAGTHQTRDLAEAYKDELALLASRDQDPERKDATLRLVAVVTELLNVPSQEPSIELEQLVNERLPDAFNDYCAPFTSFGAHEGDGSDFGVWPDVEGLETAAHYRDGVVKVSAGDDWPELDGSIDYVFEVNDHGNVTLYDARSKQELWSCV